MYFTNKVKFTPIPIKFGEHQLYHKTQVCWLGFWLDPKLKFRHHISVMRSSGIGTIKQLRRLNKSFSGLNPIAARTLVNAVLRPKLLFGSVVWLTSDTSNKVFKIWDTLLNAANRLILGAFKTSPTNLMRHDSFMKPFRSTATQLHHNFYCKRFMAPDTHPTQRFILHKLQTHPHSHHSCISHRIETDHIHHLYPKPFETIQPHPDPPWIEKIGRVHNLDLTRDEAKEWIPLQLQTEKENGSTIVFNNGSYIPESGCGAAAAFENKVVSATIGPKEEVSNDEAELIAIGLAIESFQQQESINPELHTLAVFSDSQSAIRAIHEPTRCKSNQYITRHLKSLISQPTHPIQLKLFWVPGHEGIDLN